MSKVTNETFGISAKIALCLLNGIEYNVSRYRDRINEQAVDMFMALFRKTPEIKGLKLTKFFDDSDEFNDEIITRSPHNFLGEEGDTISIWTSTNQMPKVCPKVVGQPGIDTANKVFGHLASKPIYGNSFKQLVFDKPIELLDIYFDYLMMSDVLIFVKMKEGRTDKWISDNYEICVINSSAFNGMDFERENISFTRSLQDWKESTTIRYQGLSIGEFQVHKNRFIKFRFIIVNFLMLLRKKARNNETLGASAEFAVIQLFRLSYPKAANLEKRVDVRLLGPLKKSLKTAFKHNYAPIRYVGMEGGIRERSKSSIDFILQGDRTLSLKSNHAKSNKVCPPEIGQPSYATFDHYFGNSGLYIPPIDECKFKSVVYANKRYFLMEYMRYLFDCDQFLWVYGTNPNLTAFNNILVKDANGIICNIDSFKEKDLTFTRSLHDWNESNTLKHIGKAIGEYQVHSQRNSLKFRFAFYNLMKQLER